MKAASLFCVFALAKLMVLFGHTPMWNWWAPLAYFWQDALIAVVFGAAEFLLRRSPAGNCLCWVLYWLLATYAVLNIPVGRAVATPLTWAMLRAARGPLADSILLYATWTNALLVVAALGAAALLPRCWGRVPRRAGGPVAAAVALLIALGPFASVRVDAIGLDRNVVVALILSARPGGAVRTVAGDWRRSPFPSGWTEDLTRFRGAAKGRNVILVSLESTAAQYVSDETMPNLSAMARHAIKFDAAYAVYPESIKGLFSVLCSAYPPLGVRAERLADAPCEALPGVLADAGYRTGLFHSGRFDYLGMEAVIRHRGYQTLEDAGDIGGNHNSSFGVDEPSTVARMLAWIDATPRGKPFFLTYLPIAGHHPYQTPERGPFPERDEIGSYKNALHYGDVSLGVLAEGLRIRGIERDTVWILYGDHGEAFGQHPGNYGHTFFLYEENIHVPLFVILPALIQEQIRVGRAVSLVDIAPSLLDLLGISGPQGYSGNSVLDAEPRMALFFADYSLTQLGLRDGAWKFITERDSGHSKLFDLAADPAERANVAPGHRERVTRYVMALRGLAGL